MPFRDLTSFLTILTILSVIVTGCINSKKAVDEVSAIYIELETTSCMGPCPVYKIKATKEKVVLTGIANVELIGEYLGKLNNQELEMYQSLIEKSTVDALATSYKSTEMLDLPTTYIRIFDGNELKTIKKYGETPKDLAPYFSFFNSIRQEKNWEKISE